jgi:hypothetical protein
MSNMTKIIGATVLGLGVAVAIPVLGHGYGGGGVILRNALAILRNH